MEATISWVTSPPLLKPRNTSAPFIADSRSSKTLSPAYFSFDSTSPSRRELMCPRLSKTSACSGDIPSCSYKSKQLIAAAPAPLTTIRTSLMSLPANSSAFSRAAEEMMAVPCWSSCMTGMSSSAFNRRSISNASGALMSSKLMPPNVGAIAFTVEIKWSMSVASTSISNTSMSAKTLNNTALPSITGLLASGPISPKPRTAVPLVTTATKLPFAVY